MNTNEVKRIAKTLRSNGSSQEEIAKKLNTGGYRTIRGKKYTQTAVSILLRSEKTSAVKPKTVIRRGGYDEAKAILSKLSMPPAKRLELINMIARF